MRRVAVTGLGAVCALGTGVPAMWEGVLGGRCAIGPIRRIPTDRLTARIAAEAVDFEASQHFDRRRLQMLDRTAQMAVVAGREAMTQAGLSPGAFDSARAGVILGASIGLETFDDVYRVFYGEGAARVPPLTVPRIMPNAPASAVSMEFGLRGAGFAVSSACASATHAIGLAFQMIRAGMLDLAVTGGSDAPITVGFVRAWDALRVLSSDGCRPFSRDRSGLVIGEGAGVLVLEPMDAALARGAPVLAEVAGFGMSADAADLTAPDEGGASAAMTAAMADAGLQSADVGYINAHGTGTRLNDKIEAAAVRRVFGEPPPLSSTKSMIGHCMAGAGGLEAVITTLALNRGALPPTAGFREPDPECDVDCIAGTARSAAVTAALSSSFAFGGLNAVLAFRRAPGAVAR